MELIVESMGVWGKDGSWRADVHCNTLEDFLQLPTNIVIDNHIFTKDAYNNECKTAFYNRKVHAVALDSSTKGTFEIIDVFDPKADGLAGVRRTHVTVE